MKLKVRVTTYGSMGSSYSELKEFSQSECLIGRNASDVAVKQPGCAWLHAVLYQGPNGELRIRSLSSSEATYLGNEKICDSAIGVGSTLLIASTAISILHFENDPTR